MGKFMDVGVMKFGKQKKKAKNQKVYRENMKCTRRACEVSRTVNF